MSSPAGTGAPKGDIALRIVRWQASHGRHQLPWQNTRDPYRVWLSEIMLQQTQVSTVLDYFARFLARFPDVAALAAAHEDEVLGLWSGLGYYSRARNLHRCARMVVAEHGGAFPSRADLLQTLPGIGRSTAAAIAAFCFGERVAILDGNVKRVLSRALGYGHDLSVAAHERALWDHATDLLPAGDKPTDIPRYTQGLMDLGATVCVRRGPECEACPLAPVCVARRDGLTDKLPFKSRRVKRSAQSLWLLLAQRADGAVWLQKRPPKGVWASLYCLPVFDSREALAAGVAGTPPDRLADGKPFLHVLTHKDLYLHPVFLAQSAEAHWRGEGQWVSAQTWPALGLPAPVRKLIEADARQAAVT